MRQRADIKIGFSCNNNCRHCVVGDRRGKVADKSLNELRHEFKEAVKQGCEEAVLTGGEPTLRRDILPIISSAKEAGFEYIQIQTNGRMLSYQDFCKKIVEAGAIDFVVAVHGHIPDLHDYLTGGTGNFAQTVKGIQNLKRLNQHVAINVVVTKPNYRHLPAIAQLLVKLGVDQIQFAFVHPLGSALKNFYSIVPRKSLTEPYVKRAIDVAAASDTYSMTEAIPYCFMSSYENYVAETFIPQTMIYDVGAFIPDFTKQRINDGKLKAAKCSQCCYTSLCEGPWKEYPEHYGWEEFVPVPQEAER